MNALLLLTALTLTPPPPPAPPSGPSATETAYYLGGVDQSAESDDPALALREAFAGVDRHRLVKRHPEMISGHAAEYTSEALEHGIEGTLLVKCRLTGDGSVRNCRVVKGLPYLNDAAVSALESRTYRPVMVRGKAVEVHYLFNLLFKLPAGLSLAEPPEPSAPTPADAARAPIMIDGDPKSLASSLVGMLLTLLGVVMLGLHRTPLWRFLPLSEAWRQRPALSTLFALAFAGFAALWTLSTWFFS